jgi:hypothetical protein
MLVLWSGYVGSVERLCWFCRTVMLVLWSGYVGRFCGVLWSSVRRFCGVLWGGSVEFCGGAVLWSYVGGSALESWRELWQKLCFTHVPEKKRKENITKRLNAYRPNTISASVLKNKRE